MKNILYTALIAFALGSPVRGEVISFECVNLKEPSRTLDLDIVPEAKLALVHPLDPANLTFVDWRSDAITWQQRVGRLHGSGGSLDFFVFSDDYRLTVASFYAAFPPENHLIEEYLCIPGVMDLGQVMRDAVR